MRKPKYLSPSSIDLWQKDRREWYIKYGATVRMDKIPQTDAMSVGSAFDSLIKAHIQCVLDGEVVSQKPVTVDRVGGVVLDGAGLVVACSAQYLSSVEPQNDGTALRDGWIVYQDYLRSGALARLMTELPPGSIVKMENTVAGFVPGTTVPLSGKPDLYCIKPTGAAALLDWKVNGFYSKAGAYPNPAAYGIYCCTGAGYLGCGSKVGRSLEDAQPTWANQLVTYGWCLGLDNPHCIIDQMAYRPGKKVCARTQGYVGAAWIEQLRNLYIGCWQAIESEWIFTDLTIEASKKLCDELDSLGTAFGSGTPAEDYFKKVAR